MPYLSLVKDSAYPIRESDEKAVASSTPLAQGTSYAATAPRKLREKELDIYIYIFVFLAAGFRTPLMWVILAMGPIWNTLLQKPKGALYPKSRLLHITSSN